MRRSAEHGFTLIELMVVVTVIALVSAAVALALPSPGGRVREEAERFAARVRAAQSEAIVTASPISVWIAPGGYGFERRQGGRWVPIGDKPFRLERWPEGARAELPAGSGRMRVTFDPTGLADRPLDVRIASGRAAALVRIDANGGARVDAG